MRVNRIKCFEKNVSSVKDFFLNNAHKSELTEYLQQYFGIKATSNDANESSPTWLEIFWEDRNIDIDHVGKDVKEKGAKVSFRCSVRGYVTILLSPCSTDSLKCKEDGIILFHNLNPCWLGCSIFRSYLWRVFVAYSALTATDGNPSFFSRCLVSLIRYFCTRNVNGILEDTRLWHDLRLLLSIFFAFVSSSLFVYFLPLRNDEKINIMDNKISEQRTLLDSLRIELKLENQLSTKLDSIVYYQKLIENNTKQKKEKK